MQCGIARITLTGIESDRDVVEVIQMGSWHILKPSDDL